MIQRIQSLYLLIITALMAVTLFCPIAKFNIEGEEVILSAFGVSDTVGTLSSMPVWMGILLAGSTLLPFVTIFLFKRRMLQIRLCGVEIALLVGDLALMVFYIYQLYANFLGKVEWGDMIIGLPVIMPIVSIVLVVLAMRATLRDELLVRSLDRIR